MTYERETGPPPPKGNGPATHLDGHQTASTTTCATSTTVADGGDIDPQAVKRADHALRRARAAGLIGPDVEKLQDWVAPRRACLRRRDARTAVAGVLDEIGEHS